MTTFCFHSVSDSPCQWLQSNSVLNISFSNFKRLINAIASSFSVISPELLLNSTQQDICRQFRSPCLLTFDDGYADTFLQPLAYLSEAKIPSLHFLNSFNVVSSMPIASSFIDFIFRSQPRQSLASILNIQHPYHIHIHPSQFSSILQEIPLTLYEDNTLFDYCPRPPSLSQLQSYSSNPYVFYASHMDEHWNSSVLTDAEFTQSLRNSLSFLSSFHNFLPFLSFPNGVPNLAFASNHIKLAFASGFSYTFGVQSSLSHKYSSNAIPRLNVGYDGFLNPFNVAKILFLTLSSS